MRSVGKPIIQAEINGKKGFFLIDTGADVSVINTSLLKRFDLEEVEIYRDSKRVIAFNGVKSQVMKIKGAKMLIGKQLDHYKFYSLDLDELTQSIEAKTGLKISGIIGADLLLKYNCIIDYNQRHVTMVNSRASKRLASK